MILGDITPSQSFVYQAVGLLFLVLSGLGNIAQWMDRKSIQKREISFSFEAAPKKELERHIERYQQDLQTVDRRIDGLDRTLKKHVDDRVNQILVSGENREGRLTEKVEDLQKHVSSLETATRNQDAWLARIDEKLDQIHRRND